MKGVKVTVLVYRGESFYFAHMEGWQRGLIAPMTKKYWDSGYYRSHEPNFEFATDEEVEGFWSNLDVSRFRERFTITVNVEAGADKLIASAMNSAKSGRRPLSRKETLQETLYGLFHLESGFQIERNASLESYQIEDGDHLGLILEHPPHAMYSLIPLPDSESVFAAIRSSDANPPELNSGSLRGALLYTDEDADIATYVRKHFASLSEASGPNVHFYVIEQPVTEWRDASRYWKGVIDERLQREWATLGWLKTKPYKPEEAYTVARQLGVYADELPCLVLFDELSNPAKLVFPILAGDARYFRVLFGQLQRLIFPDASADLTFAGARREYGSIVETLRVTADAVSTPDRVEYRFEGQTVFINNPSAPVQLSDFQNSPPKEGKT